MLKSPNVSVSARPAPWSAFRLARLIPPLTIGCFVCLMLMCLLAAHGPSVQAAPPVRPLTAVTTDTLEIAHSPATTHEMSVFGNGRITDRFRSQDAPFGRNQINTIYISNTTIAVMFDQHISTTNAVDVGSQGEFSPIGPISLYTSPDYHFYPQYTEDTGAIYASRVLSYQITQRTLATTANNCVIMELDIRNTSSSAALTGGKLLYMVDIDVATAGIDDRGGYDPAQRLVYLKDEALGDHGTQAEGYAMGISLLEGSWGGYGILGNADIRFPDPTLGDARLRNELITPTNTISDAYNNNVTWIVANIPDLAPGGESSLAFGLCARYNASAGADAVAAALVTSTVDLAESFNSAAELSVSKTAVPPAGSSVVAGEPITYRIAISNTGCRTVGSIVATDALPASIDLITYSTSQGSITASNRLVTASVGSLSPGSVATVTLMARPAITTPDGTIISNQANITSNLIVTHTSVVTHRVVAQVLMATKRADPWPSVGAGERLTYTIVISNGGQGSVSGVAVSDTLPANTQFVAGSIGLTPSSAGIAGTIPPALATEIAIPAGQSVTVTLAVTVSAPLPDGTIIANTAAVTRTGWVTPTIAVVTNAVHSMLSGKVSVDASGGLLYPADTLIYTVMVTNFASSASQTNVVITDSVPTSTTLVAGSVQSNANEVSIVGDSIIARRDTLGPGQVFTLTFRVTVDLGTGGMTIGNQAYVASDQQPNPPQPPPTADVVTTAAPGLALNKWAAPDRGSDDSWTQYHFLVTNTGNMPLTNIQIWDDHLSPTIGPFNVPDLPARGTYTVTRWWPVNADVTNVATVTARALGFPDPLSASDDAFFDAVHPLNLAFDVSVEPEVIPEAQTVTYTYRLTNIGTEWLVGGTITDTQWGVIASGLELAPGAAYTQIVTQWVATTTINAALASGFNLLGVRANAADSATVTMGTLADYTHTLYLPIVIRNY